MAIERIKPAFHFEAERLEQLKQIAPEAFADGKINWETLQEALGDYLEEEDITTEHFGLFWPGKKAARKIASIPSEGTLIPCPGEGVDEEITKNIFIEGENLEVLKLLQKSYPGRIKMIYIDPPYNTGSDFIYEDTFAETIDEYLRRTGQLDEEAKPISANTKTDGRFHSKWLSMVYPRLRLARNLLKSNGAIFVSIDDNEVSNLKLLMNEVFGEENFIAQLVWANKEGGGGSDSSHFRIKHEYVLCYCKDIAELMIGGVEISNLERYTQQDEFVKERGPYYLQKLNQASIQYSKSLDYPILSPDKNELWPQQGSKRACWRWGQVKLRWGIENKFIEFKKDKNGVWQVYTKQYLNVDNNNQPILRTNRPGGLIEKYSSTQASKKLEEILGPKVFSYPKPVDLISHLISLVCDEGDYVIDFFAGSGTTGQAVFEYRIEKGHDIHFILTQLDEPINIEGHKYKTISEVTINRLRKVSKLFKKDSKSNNKDLGFKVFKLAHSNFKIWKNYTGNSVMALELQFENSATPLVENWASQNLLTEIVLIEGFPLDSKFEMVGQYKKNEVTMVTSDFCEHKLLVCLDKKVYAETIKNLQLNEDDVFICLDSAITDQDKVILQDKGLIKTI